MQRAMKKIDDDDDDVSVMEDSDCDLVGVASADDCVVVSTKVITEVLDDAIARMFSTPDKCKRKT